MKITTELAHEPLRCARRKFGTLTQPTNTQKLRMMNKSIAKFFVLAASILTVPTIASAAHKATVDKEVVEPKGKNPIEMTKESCITGDLGVNVVSQYISRGVVLENQGSIIQPYADLYFKLYEGEGFLNKIQLNLGIWSSIHSEKTDEGAVNGSGISSTGNWYEFDYTVGVSFTFAKNWTLTPSLYSFLSPNDGFSTFYGLNTKLAFDDTDLLGPFALHPYVQVMYELENKAGTGADEGIYYEVGIAPSFPLGPVSVTFPITAGFGSGDFYGSLDKNQNRLDDEWFGYVSGGVNVAYAMKFIPECYGTWTATAGYTFYELGEGTSDFNTPQRGGSVRDDSAADHEHVFSGGLSVAF